MIFDIIYQTIISENISLESEWEKVAEKIADIQIKEILEKSDQDIKEFLAQKNLNEQSLEFQIIQKIKINQTLKNMTVEHEEEKTDKYKQSISEALSIVHEPDEISITSDNVTVKYNFSVDSIFRKKIEEMILWDGENAKDTISKRFNIPAENIVMINSVTEYVDFVSGLEESDYVSRGQRDCTYELLPSLHRIYDNDFSSHAEQLESAFKQKVMYYDKTLEQKDREEIRAYAQHFGLPTNYLDFTEAHLISLLFAVEEFDYTQNHSIVYFVDALAYNRDVIKEEIKLVDFSDKNLKQTKQDKYQDKSYFIKVGNSNERIHFQKGCFLKVEPYDKLSKMYEMYMKVAIINKECKEQILRELFKLGITFENIYPDRDNMVKTIKFLKNNM